MSRRGVTLIELVLVLVIMAAIGALIVPLVGGLRITVPNGDKLPEQIATEATMNIIRDVIMGTPNGQGVWADLGQRAEYFPRNPDHLLLEYSSVSAIAEYAGVTKFDPVTKIGWRGPYLVGHSNIIDAWGNDIVIQIPDANGNGSLDQVDVDYARLVSFGEDGVPSTPESIAAPQGPETATTEIPNQRGDDIVLFLQIADPAP